MNNRQAGRRRGRGGQRSPGNPNSNSRIDNRQRGNASQLYEKYKNLARDAQMQGDRVNTEYYLQFADHYFRVLNENKPRVEEHRRQHDDDSEADGDFEAEDRGRDTYRRDRGEQRMNGRGNGHADDRDTAEPAGDRPYRHTGGEAQPQQQVPSVEETPGSDAPVKRGRGRPRKEARPADEAAAIDADRLPPALGSADNDADEAKPRRRGRPPKNSEAATATG